jgi:hypothetical protein
MVNFLRLKEAAGHQSLTLPFTSPCYDQGVTGLLACAFFVHLPAHLVFVDQIK